MSGEKFKAPSRDFGILAIPPIPEWPKQARTTQTDLKTNSYTLGGIALQQLRKQARLDFVRCAREWNPKVTAPDQCLRDNALWFMTGHQPELYHAGVWAKNFSVHCAASLTGGFGFNLVADSDQIKSESIRIPSGSLTQIELRRLALDTVDDGRPYESWEIQNADMFHRFGTNVVSIISSEIHDPLIDPLWPAVVQTEGNSVSQKLSQARQHIEKQWGYGLTEAPMSMWSETVAVRHIFCMILSDLPRFHAIHEEELLAYRKLHRIRSQNHPVADLNHHDGWWEAPLWVWRRSDPKRRRLWVRICQNGSGVHLRIDGEAQSIGCLAIRPDSAMDQGISQLHHLADQGICIRPRAIVTTALCRTLLADLFIHGIGGALYDQFGDRIFTRFFGITPPEFAVLSATLRIADLPEAVASEKLFEQISLRRRIQWKAETLSAVKPEVQNLIDKKQQLLAIDPPDRKTRRFRASQLRKINHQISLCFEKEISEVTTKIALLKKNAQLETLTRSREFSIAVHSTQRLRKLAERIRKLTMGAQPT